MNLKTVAEMLSIGLEREKSALVTTSGFLAALIERLETDARALEINRYASFVWNSDKLAFSWLADDYMILQGKSPIDANLAGNGKNVMQILSNIQYVLPV